MNEGGFTSEILYDTWNFCLGVTKMTELRNKKKRCKYQKQYVITIEHFRFQLYKVFLYSCSFCKLCFKGTPLLAFLCRSSFLIFRKFPANIFDLYVVSLCIWGWLKVFLFIVYRFFLLWSKFPWKFGIFNDSKMGTKYVYSLSLVNWKEREKYIYINTPKRPWILAHNI